MWTNLIALIAITTSVVSVYLQYWKEIKTKEKGELYLKKQEYYEDLIQNLTESLFQDDITHGRNLIKLYHKAWLYSNDEVIRELNKMLDLWKESDKTEVIKL